MTTPAILALEDGSVFHGLSIGVSGTSVGEVVFNTAMTGYQEIATDPSYCRQLVTLTCPHIGNVGVNAEDVESNGVQFAGLIVRDLPLLMSNWRADQDLQSYLRDNDIVAIAEVDTRRLTRILRDKGALAGCIWAADSVDEKTAIKKAQAFPGLKGMDLAKVVSAEKPYTWDQPSWLGPDMPTPPEPNQSFKVVAYDFGVKHNILRLLVNQGCEVTVVPARTPAADVLAQQPDGVFLSNGPGDPEPCDYAIENIKQILAAGMPTFGICLGHQLLGLASGASTLKMKFGHHGSNHPVQNLADGRVMITSQNHGFAVDENSLPDTLRATHRSLFDGSLQGIERVDCPAFSFQGHPEASPGPHDVRGLFQKFIDLMNEHRAAN